MKAVGRSKISSHRPFTMDGLNFEDTSSSYIGVNFLWMKWILSIWLNLLAIAIFYYLKWSRSRTVKLINAIPGRKPLPLLGNLLDLDVYNEGRCLNICCVNDRHEFFVRVAEFLKMMTIDWVKEYGPIYRVWLCTRPFVTLSSPELVQVCSLTSCQLRTFLVGNY